MWKITNLILYSNLYWFHLCSRNLLVRTDSCCHAEFISASPSKNNKDGFLIYFNMTRLIQYSVYIMANQHATVLYIGVTSDLQRRVWQHKNGEGGVFTSKYNCHFLLYYEDYQHINKAIEREKQLKNWRRQWKLNLVKSENPLMKDLAADW